MSKKKEWCEDVDWDLVALYSGIILPVIIFIYGYLVSTKTI